MTRILRSALVIGRRDFSATVFSKAFIFFLIGPLFPVFLVGLFGGIGAHVTTQADQSFVAVVASEEDFERLEAARGQLAGALAGRAPVILVRADPSQDRPQGMQDLLGADSPPVVAVLTGGLERPHLTGAIEERGRVASEMGLLITLARDQDQDAQPLSVTRTEQAAGTVTRSRAITGQFGQMALFFLTIILAGMTLSQLIEEKSNKVIEVLAAAVPIESIFLGKLLAMLAASVIGIAVWLSVGLAAVWILFPGAAGALPTPAVGTATFIALGVIYFAMNYLLLGSVFLSIGAQASTAREVQTLSMPVTVAQVLIFGFAAFSVGMPDSAVAIGGAAFPLSSPLVMLARAAERPELWTHALAIGWQALWVGLIVAVSARLFRRTVLKSGPALKSWWKRARA